MVEMDNSTLYKGKRGEFLVFGELIKRGYDLYLPTIDMGIDAVVRLGTGEYIELQVKTTQAPEQAGYFNIYDLEVRPNLFIVCVDMSDAKLTQWGGPEVWILPSQRFFEYSTKTKVRGSTRYHLPLPAKYEGHRKREEILELYCTNKNPNAWELRAL